jgi:hypothetical protein
MHAYAADDPVFLAMNARGQRETDGELGDFCVDCHAPMAVRLGLTTDGLNLHEVPAAYKGVTCYFCHNVESVEGTHNNPLELSMDGTMRAGLKDPVANDSHASEFSTSHDRGHFDSSRMCGSCHDIITPAGVHIERTYDEWLATFYADSSEEDAELPAPFALTCNGCHMPGVTGAIASVDGAPVDRRRHEHHFVGVDVALTEFPDASSAGELKATQLAEIAEVRRSSLCSSLCVDPGDAQDTTVVTLWLHNESAGHAWPSGAAQDRRAWVELVGFIGTDAFYESGVVASDVAIADLDDPDLWLFRDFIFDGDGNEVHMFWDARDYTSSALEAAADISEDATTWVSRSYEIPSADVERVTSRVRIRPMGFDVLDDLIATGDLDPAIREQMLTFNVEPTQLEWTEATASPSAEYGSCVHTSSSCRAPGI